MALRACLGSRRLVSICLFRGFCDYYRLISRLVALAVYVHSFENMASIIHGVYLTMTSPMYRICAFCGRDRSWCGVRLGKADETAAKTERRGVALRLPSCSSIFLDIIYSVCHAFLRRPQRSACRGSKYSCALFIPAVYNAFSHHYSPAPLLYHSYAQGAFRGPSSAFFSVRLSSATPAAAVAVALPYAGALLRVRTVGLVVLHVTTCLGGRLSLVILRRRRQPVPFDHHYPLLPQRLPLPIRAPPDAARYTVVPSTPVTATFPKPAFLFVGLLALWALLDSGARRHAGVPFCRWLPLNKDDLDVLPTAVWLVNASKLAPFVAL